jgi:hypothetical protein
MKRYTMLFAAMALAALPLFANDALLGRWEGVDRNRNLAQTFEFRPNGEVVMSAVVAMDAKYVRDGATVKIITNDTSTASFEFEANDTTMTRKSNGESGTLTRVGAPVPSDPLTGTWKYEYRLGGSAYEIFAPDGTFHFRYPFTKGATTGKYEHGDTNMTIRYADGRVVKVTAVVEGNELSLTDDLGKVSKMVRAIY